MALKSRLKEYFSVLKETYKEWSLADPWRLSAAVAYNAILSLPALLVIIINIAGAIFGDEAVQGIISAEIGKAMGPDTANTIETMIANASGDENTTISTIIGIGVLLFAATGVFFYLQKSLNEIWGVKTDPKAGIKKYAIDRATGLGLVIVIGFLLLISLVITSVLSALGDWIKSVLPDFLHFIFMVVNLIFSLAVITVLFALIFKYLPDVKIKWRSVWIGAGVTSLLFVIGKYLLGLYFGEADPGSAYGATGSIILILLWVSYSCLILFFGAEFTQVFARRYGHPIEPDKYAVKIPTIQENKKKKP
jgi:membrane protein